MRWRSTSLCSSQAHTSSIPMPPPPPPPPPHQHTHRHHPTSTTATTTPPTHHTPLRTFVPVPSFVSPRLLLFSSSLGRVCVCPRARRNRTGVTPAQLRSSPPAAPTYYPTRLRHTPFTATYHHRKPATAPQHDSPPLITTSLTTSPTTTARTPPLPPPPHHPLQHHPLPPPRLHRLRGIQRPLE